MHSAGLGGNAHWPEVVNAIRLGQVADDEVVHRYSYAGPLLNAVARRSPNW